MELFSSTTETTDLSSATKWANPQLLVTPQQVKESAGSEDLVVVDCRPFNDYMKGHIPGAISLGDQCDRLLRDAKSTVFANTEKYEKIFGSAGIGNDTHVVFYHGSIKTLTSATVAFWVLEYLGHDKVHLLNGGLEAWEAKGYQLEKTPTVRNPKKFKVTIVQSRIATTDEILKIARGETENVQLVDSRTREEFEGKVVKAVRGGHVPNVTMNVSHIDTVNKTEVYGKMFPTGYLSPDVVAEKFASLDKGKRTISYCQTGTRSTVAYLQFRLLGFENPANWDESWLIYGAHPDGFPVAKK